MTAPEESEVRSAVTLRALRGTPLAEPALRDMVLSTAHAIAERQGVRVIELIAHDDHITATLEGERIIAIGFASELRRITGKWFRDKYEGELWGQPRHHQSAHDGVNDDDAADDDPTEAWKRT